MRPHKFIRCAFACVCVQHKQLRRCILFFSVMYKRTPNVYPVADESRAAPPPVCPGCVR